MCGRRCPWYSDLVQRAMQRLECLLCRLWRHLHGEQQAVEAMPARQGW